MAYHTFKFLRRRRKDPKWRDEYHLALLKRLCSVASILLVVVVILNIGKYSIQVESVNEAPSVTRSSVTVEAAIYEEEIQTDPSEEVESSPYAVDPAILFNRKTSENHFYPMATFGFFSVNAPNLFRLERIGESRLQIKIFDYYIGGDFPEHDQSFEHSVSYELSVVTIPTKEITIFNGAKMGPGKRTVKVNTELKLLPETVDSIDSFSDFSNYKYYLFHNSQGEVSLIVPNFAGNVGVGDLETMAEYNLLTPEEDIY